MPARTSVEDCNWSPAVGIRPKLLRFSIECLHGAASLRSRDGRTLELPTNALCEAFHMGEELVAWAVPKACIIRHGGDKALCAELVIAQSIACAISAGSHAKALRRAGTAASAAQARGYGFLTKPPRAQASTCRRGYKMSQWHNLLIQLSKRPTPCGHRYKRSQ
jgi:hypothetical protein